MKVELNKLQPIRRRPTPDEYKELQNLKEQRHMLFEDGTLAALDKRLNELSKESNRWDKRKRMVFSLCKRNGLYLFGRQYQGGKK